MKERVTEMEGMSKEELAALAAACLERLEPGRQPFSLFEQLARHVVTSTVEIVPLLQSDGAQKVLLARRPDDDPWWPGMWHLPGTILLPSDAANDTRDYDTPIERLLHDEFHGSIAKVGAVNLFDIQRRSIPRGKEQTVFGWIDIVLNDGYSHAEGGTFFDVTGLDANLPDGGVIDGHMDTIRLALKRKGV